MLKEKKYNEVAEAVLKKINSRVLQYSVETPLYPGLVAWGQHIDDPSKGQYGIYGTSGAIEIIDRIDTDESYNKSLPDKLKKAIDFLNAFLKDTSVTTTEGKLEHQLTLLPKLASLLSCMSKRLAENYEPANTLRTFIIERIKKSQNEDGGWPPYNPALVAKTAKKPSSDPLVTALVLSAVSKSTAKADVNFQKSIDYLMQELQSADLPLHVQLYALYAIRSASPEISDGKIKKYSKDMIRAFDKQYDNLIEVYCPFDAAMVPGTIGAHYFVVKQKTLLLHYIARFEFARFCFKEWVDRAMQAIKDIDDNDGGERSRISYRVGTRNTLSAVLFLINSKMKVKNSHRLFNFIYYTSFFYRTMLLQFIITALIFYCVYKISPLLLPVRDDQPFFYDLLKSLVSASIFSLAKTFWGKK